MCNIPYIVNLMCLFEGNTEGAKTLLFSLFKLHSEWYPSLTPWCCAVVPWYSRAVLLRRRGLVIITTARLHSCSAQFQIPDGEDPWQCFRQETRLNVSHRSAIQQKQFIIIIIIIIIVRKHYLNKIRHNYHIILMESDNISTKKISLERS